MVITYSRHKGSFIKHCPCSPGSVSCGYYNLNLHTGCPYSCSYCILQEYLNNKKPVFFTNWDDMERELRGFAAEHTQVRIGSGELSDSLAWEKQTKIAARLLDYFRSFPDIVFEFKTKSVEIEPFVQAVNLPPNIVVSWSLAPQELIDWEEVSTPSLNSRIAAIETTASLGCKVGLHFDPVIMIGDWERRYDELIRKLGRRIGEERIAWISLGALRFSPAMRSHLLMHRQSRIFQGELVRGYDGKYRYFKPLRQRVFRLLKQSIVSNLSERVPVYLCMEDREMWEEIFPERSVEESEINRLLYESVYR